MAAPSKRSLSKPRSTCAAFWKLRTNAPAPASRTNASAISPMTNREDSRRLRAPDVVPREPSLSAALTSTCDARNAGSKPNRKVAATDAAATYTNTRRSRE